MGAGSKRVVKGKTSGFYLIHTDTTVGAGKTLTEIHKLPVHGIYY